MQIKVERHGIMVSILFKTENKEDEMILSILNSCPIKATPVETTENRIIHTLILQANAEES